MGAQTRLRVRVNGTPSLDSDFLLDAAFGNVPGVGPVNKFGAADDIDIADGDVDIWDGASIDATIRDYTYSTTADIDRLSSGDVDDTFDVMVHGLDEDWNHIDQTITLTGQTPVVIPIPLIRVFRMRNVSADVAEGIIYCFVAGAVTLGVPDDKTDIRAAILVGNEQTLMAIYTVPNGKTAYMCEHAASMAKFPANAISQVKLFTRQTGEVFQIKHIVSISVNGITYFTKEHCIPLSLPAKTDIAIRANTTVNSIAVTATFDLILIDD